MSDSIRENNLEIMFSPKSVAVVGASRKEGSIGGAILKNIINFGFKGTLYPVNPNARSVSSIPAYRSLSDIPEQIDLVIIVVPAKYVKDIVKESVQLGVKSSVIITAGFREIGKVGWELENEILKIARPANMRIVGPNCMGIINAHSQILNATFAPRMPLKGKIGFISQSGALGVVVIDYATQLGLGFSKFVSLGNKADVNATDMIRNLSKDDNTDVILAYLESFNDPWNFSEVARKASRNKPIIMVKSGRTRAGARAATSHTGALATVETALTAALSSAGVIRVTSVEELFDCAAAFSTLNLPSGDGVCIVTNAGGPGTLAVDSLIASGLRLAHLTDNTKRRIRAFAASEASVENPIDLIASGGPSEFEQTMNVVVDDPDVDSLIVIFVPPMIVHSTAVAGAIKKVKSKTDKPILAVIMGRSDLISDPSKSYNFPIYQFPESAVFALRALTLYANWKRYPPSEPERLVETNKSAGKIISEALKKEQTDLTTEQVKILFESYGFKFPESQIVSSKQELLESAENIDYPLVLKMASKAVDHKSDEGGVILDIRTEQELIKAWERLQQMYQRLGVEESDKGVLLQRFYSGGVEMALGISVDHQFGPLIMVGTGGVLVEILDDVSFELVPVSRTKVRNMIRKLKGYPLLLGYRGDNPVDLRNLEDAVLKLSQLASDNREIFELDINPLLALGVGEQPVILDARVKVRNLG